MSEYEDELRKATEDLVLAVEEIKELEEALEEQAPHEWERLQELRTKLPGLQEVVKTEWRKKGSGGQLFGYSFRIQKKTKLTADIYDIVDRAEERGELDELYRYGFLEHKVNAKQLDRLPGALKAVYGKYVVEAEGTSSVFLPGDLKV